ncbi:hypothetical protein RchiOBHm_Chr7g0214081 [Rosa chinensis]|uniref:Uncharacterized protein n=1 Tax=Rosa chinensis TaxID=74649 RepID=A0A2P6PB64_ROSCH|nr:hypothetical protein RchiOBHm_Chr7g0214081 [Rosa chinensis]
MVLVGIGDLAGKPRIYAIIVTVVICFSGEILQFSAISNGKIGSIRSASSH